MENKELENYLRQIASITNGRSIEALVYREGRAFDPPSKPRPFGILKGKNGQCYKNAYYLAERISGTYVEGIAASSFGFPLQHAWVLDKHNQVIETTWKDPGTAYYGIALGWDFIHQVLLETEVYGVLNFNSPTFYKRYFQK